MLQRMLFQQFRSFTSKDQKNALSSFNVYLRTVQECFGGHSLQLYLRGRKHFQSLPQTMPFPREQLLTPLFR